MGRSYTELPAGLRCYPGNGTGTAVAAYTSGITGRPAIIYRKVITVVWFALTLIRVVHIQVCGIKPCRHGEREVTIEISRSVSGTLRHYH